MAMKGMRTTKFSYGLRDKQFVMIKREWLDNYLFEYKYGLKWLRMVMHIAYHGRTDPYGRILYSINERRRLAYTYGLSLPIFSRQLSKTIKLGMMEKVSDNRIKLNHRIFILTDLPLPGSFEQKKSRASVEPKGETSKGEGDKESDENI